MVTSSTFEPSFAAAAAASQPAWPAPTTITSYWSNMCSLFCMFHVKHTTFLTPKKVANLGKNLLYSAFQFYRPALCRCSLTGEASHAPLPGVIHRDGKCPFLTRFRGYVQWK